MLNFRQLHYFWKVAKSGGVTRAAEQLHLTPQTISGQLAEFEESVGSALFRRVGRRMELTAAGRLALSHADEIFQIGSELEQLLRHHRSSGDLPLRVGLADSVPKSMAYRLLAPALALPEPVCLTCTEDKLERLFADLAIHRLELVIADRPLPPDLGVRGYSHDLGQHPVELFGVPELAAAVRGGLPEALEAAPLLLPGENAAVFGALSHWFATHRVVPRVVGRFDDSALMKAFGRAGAGLFPAPSVLASELRQQFGVESAGVLAGVQMRYFAISVERRLTHPAVVAIREAALA